MLSLPSCQPVCCVADACVAPRAERDCASGVLALLPEPTTSSAGATAGEQKAYLEAARRSYEEQRRLAGVRKRRAMEAAKRNFEEQRRSAEEQRNVAAEVRRRYDEERAGFETRIELRNPMAPPGMPPPSRVLLHQSELQETRDTFHVMLRRVEPSCKVGLTLKKQAGGLVVQRVEDGGLAAEHNETAFCRGEVMLTDGQRVLSVNGISIEEGVESVLEEVANAPLLRLHMQLPAPGSEEPALG
eukprot:TRINITY_DN19502_c0_g1_i1.p1 TRINITY_DN19502_c0_g1~~TRINITY_DN19502_c0_g1_i1.p1  ORF type:complete len:244 (+),score=86.00 TRINITY_DN19502_c0_g1_i1:189-920(+)